MARRRREQRRKVLADPKFGEEIVTKFINCMTWSGKKSLSEKIFYGALEDVEGRDDKTGLEIFREALSNVRPLVEVRSRRVGGANYQVPTEVRSSRMHVLVQRRV